jgi:hypothetical protein
MTEQQDRVDAWVHWVCPDHMHTQGNVKPSKAIKKMSCGHARAGRWNVLHLLMGRQGEICNAHLCFDITCLHSHLQGLPPWLGDRVLPRWHSFSVPEELRANYSSTNSQFMNSGGSWHYGPLPATSICVRPKGAHVPQVWLVSRFHSFDWMTGIGMVTWFKVVQWILAQDFVGTLEKEAPTACWLCQVCDQKSLSGA